MFVELRDRLAWFDRRFNPFSRRGIARLAALHPRGYLVLTTLLAGLGYLFLLLFPALLVTMPVLLVSSLQSAASAQQWFFVTVEFMLLLLGGFASYTIVTTRFALPSGLELTARNFPRLFELLQELRQEYGEPRIDRVVLRDRFEIRVIKTPCSGFAFSTTRTLVIGLPVLLTMSPLDVHVLLARRVGQLAGRRARLDSWLYFLRDMWAQYLADCGAGEPWLTKPLCGFFRWYVPLYRSFSIPLARRSELQADVYALQSMNDCDTARAITGQVLTDAYLTRRFWPGVIQNARQSVKPDVLPHAQMAELFAAGLPEDEVQALLRQVAKRRTRSRCVMPSLLQRLDHIGHREPLLPKSLSVTAARFYLGGACDKCTEVVDRRAQKKVRSKVIRQCMDESR